MKHSFKRFALFMLSVLFVFNSITDTAFAYLVEVQRYGRRETISINDKYVGYWNLVAIDSNGIMFIDEQSKIDELYSNATLELCLDGTGYVAFRDKSSQPTFDARELKWEDYGEIIKLSVGGKDELYDDLFDFEYDSDTGMIRMKSHMYGNTYYFEYDDSWKERLTKDIHKAWLCPYFGSYEPEHFYLFLNDDGTGTYEYINTKYNRNGEIEELPYVSWQGSFKWAPYIKGFSISMDQDFSLLSLDAGKTYWVELSSDVYFEGDDNDGSRALYKNDINSFKNAQLDTQSTEGNIHFKVVDASPRTLPNSDYIDEGAFEPDPSSYAANVDELNPGSLINFGVYDQDGDGISNEGITWRVLDVNTSNQALIVTEKCLDAIQYNAVNSRSTWQRSQLYKWANESFLNTAFTSEERAAIVNTTDELGHIFILNAAEAEEYKDILGGLRAYPTKTAISRTDMVSREEGYCVWWLRDPGETPSTMAAVTDTGKITMPGTVADNKFVCVRPAMWIDISLLSFNNSPASKNESNTNVSSENRNVSNPNYYSAGCEHGETYVNEDIQSSEYKSLGAEEHLYTYHVLSRSLYCWECDETIQTVDVNQTFDEIHKHDWGTWNPIANSVVDADNELYCQSCGEKKTLSYPCGHKILTQFEDGNFYCTECYACVVMNPEQTYCDHNDYTVFEKFTTYVDGYEQFSEEEHLKCTFKASYDGKYRQAVCNDCGIAIEIEDGEICAIGITDILYTPVMDNYLEPHTFENGACKYCGCANNSKVDNYISAVDELSDINTSALDIAINGAINTTVNTGIIEFAHDPSSALKSDSRETLNFAKQIIRNLLDNNTKAASNDLSKTINTFGTGIGLLEAEVKGIKALYNYINKSPYAGSSFTEAVGFTKDAAKGLEYGGKVISAVAFIVEKNEVDNMLEEHQEQLKAIVEDAYHYEISMRILDQLIASTSGNLRTACNEVKADLQASFDGNYVTLSSYMNSVNAKASVVFNAAVGISPLGLALGGYSLITPGIDGMIDAQDRLVNVANLSSSAYASLAGSAGASDESTIALFDLYCAIQMAGYDATRDYYSSFADTFQGKWSEFWRQTDIDSVLQMIEGERQNFVNESDDLRSRMIG